jgi:hypothetical protein
MQALTTVVAVITAGFLFATPADAAKPNKANKANKAQKGDRMTARILGRFDHNHDGTLDAQEAEHARKFFNALKSLDTDKNGELTDSELNAAKLPPAGAKKGERHARKNKPAAA